MSDTSSGAAGGIVAGAGVLLLIPVMVIILLLVVTGSDGAAAACGRAGTVNTADLPEQVAGYGRDQLQIAATGMQVAADRHLDKRAQVIVVAAAMGESSLRNLGYGDDLIGVTNPDGSATCSLGVLQQQWCLGWGTKEQVLDPAYAFGTFLDRLVRVPNWDHLDVSIAINKVQGNADPYHYAKFVDPANQVVDALAGATGDSAGTCGGGDWGWPIAKDTPNLLISDFYGNRDASITGSAYLHSGVDFSVPVGTDVHTAAAGTVVAAVSTSDGAMGKHITLEHADGVHTQYLHLSAVDVATGDQVTAGQVIGKSGNTGRSTGPHLHFTVTTDGGTGSGNTTDPIAFLAARGVDLCTLPIWSGHTVPSTCPAKK